MNSINLIFMFILVILIIMNSLFNFQENFTQEETKGADKKTLIFLGDSILDNKNYVNKTDSVEYLLRENDKYKIVFLAQDNSIIADIASQMDKIPKELNNKNNYVFLSVGGNNLLNQILTSKINYDSIITLFKEYKGLIKEIKDRLPNSKLYLFNIYFPSDIKYKAYYDFISEWNTLLSNYINLNNSLKEITVDKLCNLPLDFVNDYEPSGICSKKIVNNILNLFTF